MKNDIQKSYGTLVAQMAAAIAGVELYEGPLTLSLVTAEAMNTSVAGLIAGETATKRAKAELRERLQAFRTAQANGRDYMFVARDVLKPQLGKQYSSAWDETGFVHSLSVPRNEAKLSAGLLGLNAYLTAHPEYENAPLNATAIRAATVQNELIAARNAVNSQKTVWQLAMRARDLQAAQVRKHLRALLKELSIRLDSLDERWTAFGLNKPGAKERPEAPTNITVVPVAENAWAVQWDKTPRAEYYRVRIKLVGVDNERKVVGTPTDTDFMFEELPSNAEAEITISAVNNGGESGQSEVVMIRT